LLSPSMELIPLLVFVINLSVVTRDSSVTFHTMYLRISERMTEVSLPFHKVFQS
jgi:hypothetical protein